MRWHHHHLVSDMGTLVFAPLPNQEPDDDEAEDDEDAVVVKREDDGEEYVVDWDSLFQDD